MTDTRHDRLIVLGRYPLPGRVKTRLIGALGPLGAARLQRRMTERVMAVARAVAARTAAEFHFCYAGGDQRRVRRWLGGPLRVSAQPPGDLGKRMEGCFAEAFDSGAGRVVLIGTDCVALTADTLMRAFAALDDHDVVLGPSTDGGYYLVGLRRPAGIFHAGPWGTPEVFCRTLDLVRQGGLSYRRLETLPDVDEPADLARLNASLIKHGPYVSVVIPALNEADRIGAAVASARCDGAEILVVDGGSDDATVTRARAAGARVLSSPPGRARQMNLGAAAAAGEVFLFLHADTRLPGGYVDQLFDVLGDRRVVGGAFGFATDLRGWSMALIERLVDFRSRCLHMPYGDQCLFVRRSVFEILEGFDGVAIAEDLRFVRRLRRLGQLRILPVSAITSGRRWRRGGVLRTTLANQLIVAGCLLGVPDRFLAALRGGGSSNAL